MTATTWMSTWMPPWMIDELERLRQEREELARPRLRIEVPLPEEPVTERPAQDRPREPIVIELW
jgi:hypothetical protein